MDTKLLEETSRGAQPTTNVVDSVAGTLEHATSIFVDARPRLFRIAYRVLGGAGEAEDVVQDVWLRWQGTDRAVVIDPAAYLATTTARLAINVAQSARRRHEEHAGSAFHELADSSVGPEERAERRDAVETALLLLMEKLTPAERAAYVLREAFAYPYRKISEVLRLGVANTRQLVRRARMRLATERRAPVNAASHQRLVQTFLAAAHTGELADLERLLAADVAGRATELARGRGRSTHASLLPEPMRGQQPWT